jgi:hypothetical protein
VRARLATLGALLALVAAAAVSAGCSAALDPVASAATHTADVSTLHFSMRFTLRVPGAASDVSFGATGAVDSATDRMAMTIDLSRAAALAGNAGVPGKMSVVEDGTVMYLTGDGFARFLPGGKTWMRIDLAQAANRLGLDVSGLAGGQTDPRASLAQLRKAGNVVRMGAQTIKSVATTRYNVLVDLGKGVGALHGQARDAMEQLVKRLEAAGTRYVPADAWVDADGFVRRFRIAIPGYFGAGTSFGLTMDMYGFGDPVSIAAPDPSQVADLTSALGG